jgi:hypothetical protein
VAAEAEIGTGEVNGCSATVKECVVSAAAAVAAEAAAAPFELVEPAESAMRAFETDAGGDGVRENDAASASEGCIAACV